MLVLGIVVISIILFYNVNNNEKVYSQILIDEQEKRRKELVNLETEQIHNKLHEIIVVYDKVNNDIVDVLEYNLWSHIDENNKPVSNLFGTHQSVKEESEDEELGVACLLW